MAKAQKTPKPKEVGAPVSVVDADNNERTFTAAVWSNLPQAEKDKFKQKKPSELKDKDDSK